MRVRPRRSVHQYAPLLWSPRVAVGGGDLAVEQLLSLRIYPEARSHLRVSLRLELVGREEAELLWHLPSWRRVDGSCHRWPVLLGRGGFWSRVAEEAGDR